MSLGQPVRNAPPPAPREALTFRTDPGTMRRVREEARRRGVAVNDVLNDAVRLQLLAERADEIVRRSYRLTPEQARVLDSIVASIGAHVTGEDGT